MSSAWFLRKNAHRGVRLRLFCFPYAGKGASAFSSWEKEFAGLPIELLCLQLPGRESRFRETAFDALDPLLEALAPAFEPWLDMPFAFFGHSFGSMLAFELARALRRAGKPEPGWLFMSGFTPPHLWRTVEKLHLLPDARFLEQVGLRYRGLPPELKTDPELAALVTPALRADFAIIENYVYRQEAPLDCEIAVLGASDDPVIEPDRLSEWNVHTRKNCSVKYFFGGHFFLNEHRKKIAEQIIAMMLADPPRLTPTPNEL
jgi:medium-chain acyl-[acyl-carrier-protein] hydrolase